MYSNYCTRFGHSLRSAIRFVVPSLETSNFIAFQARRSISNQRNLISLSKVCQFTIHARVSTVCIVFSRLSSSAVHIAVEIWNFSQGRNITWKSELPTCGISNLVDKNTNTGFEFRNIDTRATNFIDRSIVRQIDFEIVFSLEKQMSRISRYRDGAARFPSAAAAWYSC